MKKKRLKIKWINVIKLIIFILCITMILHDMYMLTIYTWVTGNFCGFTWFGLLTFILFCSVAGLIYDDFEEEIKKVSIAENKRHTYK